MNVLIIGGTRFQGRYLVKELLDSGHFVTVFHRGTHAIAPHERLVDLIGDRNATESLTQLLDQKFDACIDTCAYFPDQVSLLSHFVNTQHYCLISSVYVYVDQNKVLNEHSPLLPPISANEITLENYGALKVSCEKEAIAQFGRTSLILRPSIIVGLGDHTSRLMFWMRLIGKHKKHLSIENRKKIIQPVDVRDMARFTTKCIETKKQGAANVCGIPISLSAFLNLIAIISCNTCEHKSFRMEYLHEQGIKNLPYYDSFHNAQHANTLSQSWGYKTRDLKDSLSEIYNHSKQNGFITHRFQQMETAVLDLFSSTKT
jgi:2'-hydroxyisoflavone reductase